MIPAHSYSVWAGLRVPTNSASHKMWKTVAGDAWPVPEPTDACASGLILCAVSQEVSWHKVHSGNSAVSYMGFILGLFMMKVRAERSLSPLYCVCKDGRTNDRAYQHRCGQMSRKSILRCCVQIGGGWDGLEQGAEAVVLLIAPEIPP